MKTAIQTFDMEAEFREKKITNFNQLPSNIQNWLIRVQYSHEYIHNNYFERANHMNPDTPKPRTLLERVDTAIRAAANTVTLGGADWVAGAVNTLIRGGNLGSNIRAEVERSEREMVRDPVAHFTGAAGGTVMAVGPVLARTFTSVSGMTLKEGVASYRGYTKVIESAKAAEEVARRTGNVAAETIAIRQQLPAIQNQTALLTDLTLSVPPAGLVAPVSIAGQMASQEVAKMLPQASSNTSTRGQAGHRTWPIFKP